MLLAGGCDAPAPAAPEPGPGIIADAPDGIIGGGGSADAAATLVGEWQRFDIVEFEEDLVTTTIHKTLCGPRSGMITTGPTF